MNDFLGVSKTIDLKEAVVLLGVSSATVRNWIRHNYLVPKTRNRGQLLFDRLQVTNLKDRITSGEIDRLSKRANKKQSNAKFIPEEYADSRDVITLVQSIVHSQKVHALDIRTVLLALVLNFLKTRELVSYSKPRGRGHIVFHNSAIEAELEWWFRGGDKLFESAYLHLFDLHLSAATDILGLVYQSLVVEGNKAQAGSYYTPKPVVDAIVRDHIRADSLVLDPCCGTGQFLLATADKISDPSNIWGFDIDEIAVRLTRVKLLSHFPGHTFRPNVFCKNTLLDVDSGDLFSQDTYPQFDAIITNPPWGMHFSRIDSERLQRCYPAITSNEAFSYFILKSLHLLKDEGVLSFVLPEALLNIRTHKDIRGVILEQTRIKKVQYLDRIFKNVFTPVIRLDVLKGVDERNNKLEVERDGNVHFVLQGRLKGNPDYMFDVFSDDKDMAIFEKVYSREHTTLKGKADWALGVVTGDNQKYLSSCETGVTEPILTGKELRRFLPLAAKTFIHFEPKKFQQVAPEYKFRAKEKLVYRFISRELVFSYDDKQTLTLNSANILIPKIEAYPIKTILALFNSLIYQFLFQKKFNALKVLRGDIEKLPLPILDRETHNQIDRFVSTLIDPNISFEERRRVYVQLDEYMMTLFDLTNEERAHVRNGADVSSTFSL